MPLDTNIALNVRPVETPNMLAQMGQMMQMRQAQQEYESQNALRDAFAQGADISDPAAFKRIAAINPKLAFDLKGKQLEQHQKGVETLGKEYENARIGLTNVSDENGYYNWVKSSFNNPAIAAHLTQLGITPEQALANAQATVAKEGLSTAIAKSSMGIGKFMEQDRQLQNSVKTAQIATGPAYARLAYDIKNPTQHYFTGEDNTLMGVSTRGGGVAAPVPMAKATTPPSQITIGGGGAAPMGAGSSIMNPASVNAFVSNNQNALITQPQPAALPATSAFAKVRTAPTAITNVNTYTPASEAAQTEFMKGSRTTFDQLKHAPTVLENIEKAKALVPTAKGFMGTGGETMLEAAKFMNNRLGTSIDTAGIKSAEELNSRLFMGIMDNLKKMDAQPSQQQQAAMKQALGSIGTDPSAMNAVLDVFGDIVRGKVDIHNKEVMGAEQRGVKFPYNPVIKLPPKGAAALPPVYATNGKDRIVSTDGGITWNPVGAK